MNYEEDLESAKGWLAIAKENNNNLAIQILEKLFPELKESEDERIRKALIRNFTNQHSGNFPTADGFTREQILAWLEKQGEQNTANFEEAEKEKNDFVSGQFIECRKSFNEFKEFGSYWFEYVGDDTYIGRSDNILNQRFHITPQQLFTLFTHQHCPKDNKKQGENELEKYINDQRNKKDFYCESKEMSWNEMSLNVRKHDYPYYFKGDLDCYPFNVEKQGEKTIPKNIDDAALQYVDTCAVDGEVTHDNITEPYWNNHSMMNAYKAGWLEKQGEQKPIIIIPQFKVGDIIKPKPYNEEHLIKDINENGYVLDVDIIIPFKDEDVWEIVEQKPTWSEEDEKMIEACLLFVNANRTHPLATKCIDWLNSLKERIQIQLKQEWSEEDERNLKGIIDEIEANKNNAPDYDLATYDRFLSWLKSLKDRVQSHQKQGWSEEDNERLLRIHQFIWANRRGDTDEIYQQEQDADWLMTLKPQNHWKPNEEQIKSLRIALQTMHYSKDKENVLVILEQLIKLMI